MSPNICQERPRSIQLAYKEETSVGHQARGILTLDPYPLGPANLEISNKGVLVIEDLTGGTTAIDATYRYRHDKAAGRLRLIGIDAEQYSRTNSHGKTGISWNLLTGDFVKEDTALVEGAQPEDNSYADPVVKKSKRPSKPIYMEDTPSPEDLLSE